MKGFPLKPSPDVKEPEVVSHIFGHVKYLLRSPDCIGKEKRVLTSATDMEGHADEVQTELVSRKKQIRAACERCAKLETETAKRLAVVGEDAKDELGARMHALDLVKLVGVIERHHINALLGSDADERRRFARVGEDDPVGGGARRQRKHLSDLCGGGAVERCAEERQKV